MLLDRFVSFGSIFVVTFDFRQHALRLQMQYHDMTLPRDDVSWGTAPASHQPFVNDYNECSHTVKQNAVTALVKQNAVTAHRICECFAPV